MYNTFHGTVTSYTTVQVVQPVTNDSGSRVRSERANNSYVSKYSNNSNNDNNNNDDNDNR